MFRDFECLGGYRTLILLYEGQVPINPYNCCFSRVLQAFICIATYGMSVPSLHTECTRLCDCPIYGNKTGIVRGVKCDQVDKSSQFLFVGPESHSVLQDTSLNTPVMIA